MAETLQAWPDRRPEAEAEPPANRSGRETGDPRSGVRLRPGRGRSFSAALVMIALFAFLLGGIQVAFGLREPALAWAVDLFTAVFWIWVAAGLLAWWRRPDNATGMLIVTGGVALFLSGLSNLGVEPLTVVSVIFATSPLAVTVQLLHAFPSGRLRGRLSIVTVILGWVAAPVFQLLRFLASLRQSDLAEILSIAQKTLGIAVMILTAIVLARRLVAAEPRHRRVLLPLFACGIVAVLLLAFAVTVVEALGLDRTVAGVVQLLVSAAIPLAFLLGVLLGGFRRTGDAEPLSAWLGISGAGRPAVARALASTLGDDTLTVVYWSPDRAEFVDEVGTAVAPEPGGDRGWCEIRVESRLVGAIVYDARMIADPRPVRRAGEVLAIAIDRERLTAELLATNDALVQSRIRLVEAADRERSRIAQDLHDGIQVQLVLLALEAQTVANRADITPAASEASARLRRGIDEAAADLRRLVHNILPVMLTERGLAAAAEDLVDRLSIPATLDADIDDEAIPATTAHTGYFIVAEALANAVKHSGAASVRVTMRVEGAWLHLDIQDDGIGGASMSRGAGLRSLIDRVDALGGRLHVQSPRGHGTLVRVELPCG